MFKVYGSSAFAGGARRRVLRHIAGAAAALGVGGQAIAAGANASKAVRIASTLDISGGEKAYGLALHAGAMAYFGSLNRSGGINGRDVELIVADDKFNADQTKANALAFNADKSVMAILHPLGTAQAAAVIDSVHDLPVIGGITGTVRLRKLGMSNVFWTRANYDQEIEKLVSTAVTLRMTKIALVHPDDAFGQASLAAFNAVMAKHKLTAAAIATTPSTTSLEMQAAAMAITKAAPKVVIVALGATAAAMVQALRKARCNSTIYGLSVASSMTGVETLGVSSRDIAFSIVVPLPSATKFDIVRRYQADTRASGGTDFSLFGLEGYINARVLAEGIRRVTGPMTREGLIAALESVDNFDLGGLRMSFGKGNREGSSFVDMAVVGPNGRLIG